MGKTELLSCNVSVCAPFYLCLMSNCALFLCSLYEAISVRMRVVKILLLSRLADTNIHTVTADLFRGTESSDIAATFNTHSLTCPPRDPAANLSSSDKTLLVGQLWKQPGSPRGHFFGLLLTVTVLAKAFCGFFKQHLCGWNLKKQNKAWNAFFFFFYIYSGRHVF